MGRYVGKTMGKGNHKTIILYRTSMTRIPANWNALVDLILKSGIPGEKIPPRKDKNSSKKVKASKEVRTQQDKSRLQSGDVVGQGVKPISQTNLGHKMLMTMGWSPGQGLGAGEGLVEPVQVKYKSERRGLGS